jgi:hypothetical protein
MESKTHTRKIKRLGNKIWVWALAGSALYALVQASRPTSTQVAASRIRTRGAWHRGLRDLHELRLAIEFVQNGWINDRNVQEPGNEHDPIA